MARARNHGLLFVAACLALTACARVPPTEPGARVPCHIVYDAGSSGTRLYLYAWDGTRWSDHTGPKAGALADPVREIREKTWDDADKVVVSVVAALDQIRRDGPPDEKGKPKWQAFPWETRCALASASVYATAGMRLAEYQDRERSAELWRKLDRRLGDRLGRSVPVTTRTLSGYEEGLFAWLAAREREPGARIGIVEMGGASSQITFPCARCDPNDDAVRTVSIDGKTHRIYSYSFLGVGQDEAPRTFGRPYACAWGIGRLDLDWEESECAEAIRVKDACGIHDPYNFDANGRFVHVTVPLHLADVDQWRLTGAFNYMKPCDVEDYCRGKADSYNKDNACFVAVYLPKWLRELGIPAESKTADVNWTLGAVLCRVEDCLGGTPPPLCRWSPRGCL